MRKAYVAYYGANSLCFTRDCKRRNFNAGDGQTAILCIFSSKFVLYQCIVEFMYMFRCIHFFFFDMKNEVTLFIVVELKRSFFLFFVSGFAFFFLSP